MTAVLHVLLFLAAWFVVSIPVALLICPVLARRSADLDALTEEVTR